MVGLEDWNRRDRLTSASYALVRGSVAGQHCHTVGGTVSPTLIAPSDAFCDVLSLLLPWERKVCYVMRDRTFLQVLVWVAW